MIAERFSTEMIMLISQLNCAITGDRKIPTWVDLEKKLKEAELLTDSGLTDWADEILPKHLQMAVDGPVQNPFTRSYAISVNYILALHKQGFPLFEDTRFLLRSYIILNYAGILGRD